MTPRRTPNRVKERAFVDAVFGGEVFGVHAACGVAPPSVHDDSLGEARPRAVLAAHNTLGVEPTAVTVPTSEALRVKTRVVALSGGSPLGVSVGSVSQSAGRAPLPPSIGAVVGRGSEEQMRRIHARRVIATVADEHASGYGRSVRQLPDGGCGSHVPTMGGVSTDDAVSTVTGSRPRPALIGAAAVHVLPEADGEGHALGFTPALEAAINPPPAAFFGRENKERAFTLGTRPGDATFALHLDLLSRVPSPRPLTRRGGAFVPTIVPLRWDVDAYVTRRTYDTNRGRIDTYEVHP
jgi:hypothetical protein